MIHRKSSAGKPQKFTSSYELNTRNQINFDEPAISKRKSKKLLGIHFDIKLTFEILFVERTF